MAKNNSLNDRMKEYYEHRNRTYLTRRTPVIIRLDGKAFHTFTRGLKRPYDMVFHNAMDATVRYLCKEIQGCKLGYTQSDEITLLLIDYETLTTDAWFDYNVQKLCSVSASMATMAFNRFFAKFAQEQISAVWTGDNTPEDVQYREVLLRKMKTGAMFDARCFNIPREEVANCFVWRQQDATRNAIQMLGQCNFSDKELDHKTCEMIQDMLMTQKGINFNNMPVPYKRGVCCLKDENGKWYLDHNIPIFSQCREYVERFV